MEASSVEKALVTVVKCFFDHARAEGKSNTLNKAEFNKMISKELPHLVKEVSVEEKMKELDINKDGDLTFIEYWKLIGEIANQLKTDVKGSKK